MLVYLDNQVSVGPNSKAGVNLRGFALEPKPPDLLRLSAQLGQPLWRPPSPAGWPEADTTWAVPSALRERLRIAEVAARRADRLADPRCAITWAFPTVRWGAGIFPDSASAKALDGLVA
jgi:uncharacterized protein (DUF1800 family)